MRKAWVEDTKEDPKKGVEGKSNDEAETETEDDEEGKKDTEVESVAIVTSESTSWTIK